MILKKNIVHVTTVHPRNDVRILYKQCVALADEGYLVKLLVADGFGPAEFKEVKILDIGKRCSSRILRFTYTQVRMFTACLAERGDCYHLHDPELLPLGLILRLFGKAVIFDMHEDIVKQILLKSYLNASLRSYFSKVFSLIERLSLRRFSALIAASDQLAKSRIGYAKLVESVPNYVDISMFDANLRHYDSARVFHAGALTVHRGVYAMKELSMAMKAVNMGDITLIGTLGVGVSAEELVPCKYCGVIDYIDVPKYYECSNIGIILYRAVGQYGQATAVKLYEYMASGIPVILPDHGDWVSLNESLHIGICVPVDDKQKQLEALRWLLDNSDKASQLGRNGRRYVEEHANWELAKRRLLRVYQEVLK